MGEKTLPITGGCLCGAVRYEASEPPVGAGYCHCSMCKKARGGIFAVGASFRRDRFRFTHGESKIYKSSAFAERGFCGDCGTPLFYRFTTPGQYADEITVSMGSLDDPEVAPPAFYWGHWGVESKVSWFTIDDDLPQTRLEDDPGLLAHRAAADQGEE